MILATTTRPAPHTCSRRDQLTGGSSIIGPEAKLGAAVGALFLSFFSLAQVRTAGRRATAPLAAQRSQSGGS